MWTRSPSGRWLICLLALGCGDPADPNSILHGQWGTTGEDSALLIALSVGAELQLPCSSVSTDDPVELQRDGTFTFSGDYQSSTLELDAPRVRAQVSGRYQGRTVVVSLDILKDGLPAYVYTLERGINPHFEDQPPFCVY